MLLKSFLTSAVKHEMKPSTYVIQPFGLPDSPCSGLSHSPVWPWAFDHHVLVWMNTHKTAFLDHFFMTITWAGSLAVLLPLGLAFLGWLIFRQKPAEVWLPAAGFGGTVLITHLAKIGFGRPRPDLFPPFEPGYHPVRKLKICLAGLSHAVRYDFSVAYKIVLSVLVLGASFLLRQWLDFFFILTATALVLMAELFNSAIEALCDFVELRENERIRVVKDISAAAVGIGISLWFIVLAAEAFRMRHIFNIGSHSG
jgi:diacylglycerol kinase (ATP)